MRAVQQQGFGSPEEALALVELPEPEPGPADVVVAVEACAVNHLDIVQRAGWFTMPGFALPHVPGMDVAGTVVAIGRDVMPSQAVVGDRVVIDPSMCEVAEGSKLAGRGDLYGVLGIIGATEPGGYAEQCLAPASHVHRLPAGMSVLAASVFPTAWLTAWHALIEVGGLERGETVLIHAANAGVSVAAIQIAHWRGATVLATARGETKCAQALQLGVTAVCDSTVDDVVAFARGRTAGRGVDLVLDHVGTPLIGPSLFSLRPRGRFVTCGNTAGDEAVIPSLGYVFHMGIAILGSDPYRPREFAEAWSVYGELAPAPVVAAELGLTDAAEAHHRIESGSFFGKLVLRP